MLFAVCVRYVILHLQPMIKKDQDGLLVDSKTKNIQESMRKGSYGLMMENHNCTDYSLALRAA